MRHAGPEALTALAELLAAVRARGDLHEKQPGIFYRKARAHLHFHEDVAGLFADLRADGEWRRFRVSEPAEYAALLAALDRGLRN
jgi:hypothetical protein